jgi:excinuclease ABC subunit A
VVSNASAHNLKNVTAEIPLQRLVCISGVSGSGKTTLIRDVLLPALEAKIGRAAVQSSGSTMPKDRATDPMTGDQSQDEKPDSGEDDDQVGSAVQVRAGLSGAQGIERAILVDQSSIGKTPRSNPAVYIGAFDSIRELFAQAELAQQRGLKASGFSFNSNQGQCEACRGAGFEKIEMQFLSDVFIRCPECQGRRYRRHVLEVTWQISGRHWNIADLLDATVDEVIEFLACFDGNRFAIAAGKRLKMLQQVGLGYLRVGQPINTLSGGESQRLKLVRHLSDFAEADDGTPTLFLFDEPTTGLHFDDVRVLLQALQRLVDAGHSVLVIEHNLDVLKSADWLIDLGPGAGAAGGQIIAQGTPETVSRVPLSPTGQALRGVLPV